MAAKAQMLTGPPSQMRSSNSFKAPDGGSDCADEYAQRDPCQQKCCAATTLGESWTTQDCPANARGVGQAGDALRVAAPPVVVADVAVLHDADGDGDWRNPKDRPQDPLDAAP
jgi:hypothetical protein